MTDPTRNDLSKLFQITVGPAVLFLAGMTITSQSELAALKEQHSSLDENFAHLKTSLDERTQERFTKTDAFQHETEARAELYRLHEDTKRIVDTLRQDLSERTRERIHRDEYLQQTNGFEQRLDKLTEELFTMKGRHKAYLHKEED